MRANKHIEVPTPTGMDLKLLRTKRGETQDDAAWSIGYTARSWHKWEVVNDADSSIPTCAWVLYQLGGLQVGLELLKNLSAEPAPAKPTKKEEEFVHPLLATRPENYKRVVVSDTPLLPDRMVDGSPYHTLTNVGKDDDLGKTVWYDNRNHKLIFDNLRIGLRNDSPIKFIVKAGSKRIRTYLFAPHVAVRSLSKQDQEERDAIETQAIIVKGRHDKSMGKDKGESEHYMAVKEDVDFILKFARTQPINVEDIVDPLSGGILQEHVDDYDMEGRRWLTEDAPEPEEVKIDPSQIAPQEEIDPDLLNF